jgi:hypothetical protein
MTHVYIIFTYTCLYYFHSKPPWGLSITLKIPRGDKCYIINGLRKKQYHKGLSVTLKPLEGGSVFYEKIIGAFEYFSLLFLKILYDWISNSHTLSHGLSRVPGFFELLITFN